MKALLLLAAYGGLATIMAETFGVYDPGYVSVLSAGFACVAVISFWSSLDGSQAVGYAKPTLLVLLVGQAARLAIQAGPVYLQANRWAEALPAILAVNLIAAIAYAGLAGAAPEAWARRLELPAFWVAGCLALAARATTLVASPQPFIDVFTLSNQASDYVLAGLNPFTQPYRDIYDGLYGYAPSANYWPAHYLWSAAFRVAGDIRIGSVMADAVTLAVLPLVLRRLGADARLARLASLAWLSFPVSLYVIEQAWIEPVVVMLLVLAAWALSGGRWTVAGVLLGVMAAMKQHLPIVAVLAIVFGWRHAGRPAAVRLLAGSGFTFALLVMPFLAWAPGAFVQNTVVTFLERDLRRDAFSVPALLVNEAGIELSAIVLTLIYSIWIAAGLRAVARRRGGWRNLFDGLTLAYGGLFVFGKQAFCNYYYLLSFGVLLQALAWASGPPAHRAEVPARPGLSGEAGE